MGKVTHGTNSAYSYHKCRCDICVEAKRARDRDYYARNSERIIAKNMGYYHRNREALDKKKKEYRERDPERWREYQRQYLKDNAEQVNKKNRAWKRQNPWLRWFYGWNYREKERGEIYTAETLEWIKSLAGSECTYCGKPAQTIDHVLARAKGGSNDRDNLTPACHSCNKRKSTIGVEEFLKRLREEYTDA